MEMQPSPALLEVRALSKSFPGVRALSSVDFTVRRGEVHALMGENGAGKSTLIKVLTGVYRRDAGSIHLDGLPSKPRSTKQAEALGISTVYQEVNLIPHLSVAENICLGRQPTRFGFISWKEISARAARRWPESISISMSPARHFLLHRCPANDRHCARAGCLSQTVDPG